jgi:molybdenum cofactor cytidylyltransferase
LPEKSPPAPLGLLILGAGGSRRMGRPKQLIRTGGRSLIRHIAAVAVESGLGPVLVVTGSHHPAIAAELEASGAGLYCNAQWEEGIGSSIRNGLQQFLRIEPGLGALLMLLADQPNVTAAHLQRLAAAYRPGERSVVASAYSGTYGPPLLADNYYFPFLLELTGDEGGKRMFRRHEDRLVLIDFPDGSLDLDTPDDLARL